MTINAEHARDAAGCEETNCYEWQMTKNEALRVARLTPHGRAAVATVELAGNGASHVVDRFFRAANRQLASALPERRISFGYWDIGGDASEEVVVTRMSGARFEIHCHGGAAVSASILTALISAGAEEIDAKEWIRRRARSAIAAEAWQLLTQVSTARAAATLLAQFHGALESELDQIATSLKTDRSEEAAQALAILRDRTPLGLHLAQPWRVVVAGPPNVGKSSLVNAIVGYERAIVYDQPGTTRDIVAEDTALDGWPVQLIDTAGLHASTDPLETAGMNRARECFTEADLVLVVDQADRPVHSTATRLGVETRHLLVANKIDLGDIATPLRPGELPVSALTGEGIGDLRAAVLHGLVGDPVSPDAPIPFTQRQVTAIAEAERLIREADSTAATEVILALCHH
jgi:tRNA modification GTPase